jgi:hypothetical protein
LKALISIFVITCLYLPSLIYAVEVCTNPSGCPIDASGICIGCIEIDEEDTEEYKLKEKNEEERDRRESEKFWKNVSLKTYVSYGTPKFAFAGKNNSKIDRPYIHEVVYRGVSIGARLRLKKSRFSYSISSFKGKADTVKLNSDDESASSLNENVFTTDLSGNMSYTDVTIDYIVGSNLLWKWFVGLGFINYEANLIYNELNHGSFKYEIDEQSVFLNSGVNYHFLQSSTFMGLGFKVFPIVPYKSNSTDKKITQYNSNSTSPMVQLLITNMTFSFGMMF